MKRTNGVISPDTNNVFFQSNTSVSILVQIFIMLLFISCSSFDSATEKDFPVSIHETQTQFMKDYEKLSAPKGIMPTVLEIGKGNKDIILKSPKDYFEYFVFDDKTALLVLSHTPFIYLKIESQTVIAQLRNEYMQFLSNVYLEGEEKKTITEPHFEDFGIAQLALLFTPTQIFYTKASSESDNNNRKIEVYDTNITEHPYITLENSAQSVIYSPEYADASLDSQIVAQKNAGKTRYVYTSISTMYPPVYRELENNLNFSFFAFSSKKSTDSGFSKYDYDQVILFSVPFGNSQKAGDKDYPSISHGMAVIVKGNTSQIIDFLEKKGINFIEEPVITNKLGISSCVEDDKLMIDLVWKTNSEYAIDYRRSTANPDTYPPELYPEKYGNWIPLETAYIGTTFRDEDVAPGFHYYYRLTDKSTGKSLVASEITSICPEEQTTRNETSGELTGQIAITEINLIGSVDSSYPRLDGWFEVKNICDKIVYLGDIDFYYKKSSDSFSQENILFGPNCMDTYSSDRGALDYYVYPGEYFVVTREKKYLFSDLLIYNIAKRNFLEGVRITPVVKKEEIEEGKTPQLLMTIKNDMGSLLEIQGISYTGNIFSEATSGARSRSTVYGIQYETGLYDWIISENSFSNILPVGEYSKNNSCTPGRSGNKEY